MNATKDNCKGKEGFRKMLDLAEFSAKRMEARRSVEFRIFISYMTLLMFALYRILKLDITSKLDLTSVNLEIIFFCIGIFLAITAHVIYCTWQVGLGIAMRNDAQRRNFYFRKAEKISGHTVKFCDEKCNQDDTNPVPCIIRIEKYRQQFKYLRIIWKDWSRMLLVAIPTFLFLVVLAVFIIKLIYPAEIEVPEA